LNLDDLGKILVTGGTGFLGAALTRRLVQSNCDVVVLDNNSRGSSSRITDIEDSIDFIQGDVTSYEDVKNAMQGIDTIFHLAYINGTENFYNFPELILEVGVKGALVTLDVAMELGLKNYIVTSSSEVYQQPTHFPTNEDERIIIPDIKNPRFSYSGGKIITELLTIHYAAKSNLRTVICRPHNFYGPDMGYGHVIPQFFNRVKELSNNFENKVIDFPIQGSGDETRAFCFVDDAVDGLLLSAKHGVKGEIYHIGTDDEISIKELAILLAKSLGVEINIEQGDLLQGSTDRRRPDITKLSKLGYKPSVSLPEGLSETLEWYINNPIATIRNNEEGKREIIR
tara:strand:- start:20448 stop:21470 length:1023 start_codon:yes stop_codon:yes gene_type:complete